MTRSSFIRLSGVAAMFAGLFYCSTTLLDLVLPQTPVFTRPSDYVIEALFVMGLLLTIIAYAGIHVLQQGNGTRFETISFSTIVSGTVSITVAASATIIAGREVLGPIFLLGVLGALLGSICFGIAVMRAQVLPQWVGAAIIVALPASFLLEAFGGGILLGLGWLLIGYAMMTVGGKAAVAQPVVFQHQMN